MTNDVGVDNSLLPSGATENDDDSIFAEGLKDAQLDKPKGKFQARIDAAELGRSTSSNRLQIHYTLTILNGPSANITLHKYDGLATPQQTAMTTQQLSRLGVVLEGLTLQKLPAVLVDLVGQTVAIMCKQNKQFHNIYFQKLLTSAAETPLGDADNLF